MNDDSYFRLASLRNIARVWQAVSHLNDDKLSNWLRFDAHMYATKVPAEIAHGPLDEAREWLRVEGAAKEEEARQMSRRLEEQSRKAKAKWLSSQEAGHNARFEQHAPCGSPICGRCSDIAYEGRVGK